MIADRAGPPAPESTEDPRILLAGFIDGPGPFEGPVNLFAGTPEEARERVDHYADLG